MVLNTKLLSLFFPTLLGKIWHIYRALGLVGAGYPFSVRAVLYATNVGFGFLNGNIVT